MCVCVCVLVGVDLLKGESSKHMIKRFTCGYFVYTENNLLRKCRTTPVFLSVATTTTINSGLPSSSNLTAVHMMISTHLFTLRSSLPVLRLITSPELRTQHLCHYHRSSWITATGIQWILHRSKT